MRNKKHWIPIFTIFFTLFIVASLLVFQNLKERQKRNSEAKIKTLLNQSTLYLGYSSEKAFQLANEALFISKKINSNNYVVQSIDLLAQVKNIRGDNKAALHLYNEALSLAMHSGQKHYQCFSIIEIGKLYYNWGQYDTSILFFNQAKSIAENINDKQLMSVSYNYIGKYFRIKGNFEKAMPYFIKALEIAREIHDYKQIAFSLDTEGKYYIGNGNLTAALQCYLEAYTASEKVNDQLQLADVCNRLGGLYLISEQFEKALTFHKKALHFASIMNSPDGIAKAYNNIGKAYLELHKTDSALIAFQQSFYLCQQTGYKKGLVKSLTNLGKVYLLQNKPNESEKLLLKAFIISKNAGYKMGIAESSQALGNLYLSNGSSQKALPYFELSLSCIQLTDMFDLYGDNYQGLYKCYAALGNFEKALYYHELLFETEKNSLNVANHRQLEVLQITYNNERKEKVNQVLRKENELKEMAIKRKNTFIGLIIALLLSSILLSLVIYNRFYNKIKANRKLEELNGKITIQNKALEKLNSELNIANQEKDKLFSIIAHELRNPLYWFQNLAEVLSKNFKTMPLDKVHKSLLALDESSKNAFHLMDNLLHWSRSRLNRITPKYANYYLQAIIMESVKMFETIIQYKEIDLIIDMPETLEVYTDSDLLSCIVRNLVSNAIKYTPSGGQIKINCEIAKNFVTVVVSDTGIGIAFKNLENIFKNKNQFTNPGLMNEKGSGLGLKLCKEFAELNGGNIWATKNEEKGTKFMFTVILSKTFFTYEKKVEAVEQFN
jgi:signal transduction histidine kinase